MATGSKPKMPACIRCSGRNWIDLGPILTTDDVILTFVENGIDQKIVQKGLNIHYYACGGGLAHCRPEDVKNGCMRVIRASPEEMEADGTI
jgi:hypothetical protein